MRRIVICLMLAVVLIGSVVACNSEGLPKLWDTMYAMGAEALNTTAIVEGNIMAVFYLLPKSDDSQVVYWCVNSQIVDRGDGKWDIYNSDGYKVVEGMNQDLIEYSLYSYMILPNPLTVTYYLGDYDLVAVTWQDLPQSRHIALLANVYLVDGKPRADVVRLYMGVEYLVTGCRVAQSAYDAYTRTINPLVPYCASCPYLAPENENSFVAVDFIHENFTGKDIVLPFVADKLLK